jgi:hypothetical protein
MDAKKLEGVWYESSEESDGDRVVYRGTGYEFPRTRAPRPSMELGEGGALKVGRPGPADARDVDSGTWQVRGKTLTVTAPGRRDVYTIESVDQDALILRRKETANGDP